MALKLKRKTAGWTSGIIAVICLIAIGLLAFGTYEFSLTEDTIQAKVSEGLPIKNKGVTIEVIKVSLGETDVTIIASGTAEKIGQKYAFTISATGVPEYRWVNGGFYFQPVDLELVHLEDVSKDESLTDQFTGFANKYLSDEGSVRLQTLVTDLAPKVQKWVLGVAKSAAIHALERRPVYVLPSDAKGIAAQAVLDSISIEGQELHVQLSLYRLTTWVLLLGFVLMFSFAMVCAAIRYPGLFMAATMMGPS